MCLSTLKITKTYVKNYSRNYIFNTISSKKLVPPPPKVTCLGILVDTEKLFSLVIPHEKSSSVKELCRKWSDKRVCTMSELQSLLRSLLHVAKCIKYASFVNVMLLL